jgi:hypothetical protein
MAQAAACERHCRMHGGSEAPKGNQNALKSGFNTRETIEERRHLRALLKDAERLLKEIA